MKKIIILIILLSIFLEAKTQTAPSHLKYFGFALVDYYIDDPNDTLFMDNYVMEVDSFTNIAQMYVNNYFDTIISRVQFMADHCVKPVIDISSVFYFLSDNQAPSGRNYDLHPDFETRWNTFSSNNVSVLDTNIVAALYMMDEPYWNGLDFNEFNQACSLVKLSYPTIPLMFIEAWPIVDSVIVPESIDLLGFDKYGVFDVSTDTEYLEILTTLKSKRSHSSQKIILVIDDQWVDHYGSVLGWSQDTIEHVVQNYYNLAVIDTSIIGLAGFTWPGLAPGWLGARSLPVGVKNKNIEIGKMIKANNDPCNQQNGVLNNFTNNNISLFPNPAENSIQFQNINIKDELNVRIIDLLGREKINATLNYTDNIIEISGFENGIYIYMLMSKKGDILSTGKFICF
jgi:hypothetical protein